MKIEKLLDIVTLMVFVFAPIVFSIGLYAPTDMIHPLFSIQLSFAELFIIVATGLLLVKTIKCKSWKTLPRPELSIILFIGVIISSGLEASNMQSIVKETLQAVLYFILLLTLVLERKQRPDFIKNLVNIIIIMVLINAALSLYQSTIESGSPYLIRGLFTNRNLLGGFYVITLPLIYALTLSETRIQKKILWLFLLLISLITIYSPFAVFCLMIAFILINILYRNKSVVITLFLIFPLLAMFFVSKKYRSEWIDALSIYETGSIGTNYNQVQRLLYDLPRNERLRKNVSGKVFRITDDFLMSSVEPKTRLDETRYQEMENEHHIKQRYVEWFAALNMMAQKPVVGFGAGHYQDYIGSHYNNLYKVNTMEPNSDNLYLVMASTIGILGLSIFLLFIYKNFIKAWEKYKQSKAPINMWCIGGIIGISLYGFFTSYMIIGLLPFFVLLLSLSILSE